jgi:BirA family biotin operon repressor/biotin-[acetyl-CoA-carboxylase] ligase
VFEIRASESTESTNDDALELLAQASNMGVVLLADYQRAGRGRRGRTWVAPPGSSLLFTTILPETVATDCLWAVPFWTALGVASGIEAATGVRVALQWPNDLLLGDRKCCGILCVSRIVGERARVGCGTGINVLRPEHDAGLAAVSPPPAFLSDVAPGSERRAVLNAILAAYETSLETLAHPHQIARAWERRAGLAGTPYRLLLDGTSEAFSAIARRLADDGSLVVDGAEGERRISLADARVMR